MTKAKGKNMLVVPALEVRTNLGKLLRRVENERRSLVIEKRGAPRAVLRAQQACAPAMMTICVQRGAR